jgi:hypothetical protein
MTYGVEVSNDSFVFTRQGILSINQISSESEILGIKGIGKKADLEKVTCYHEDKQANGIRLITQATDSLLLPHTCLFSERIVEARKAILASEIEFYNPSEPLRFDHIPIENVDFNSDFLYSLGLMNSRIIENKKCLVFLIHGATERKYVKYLASIFANRDIMSNRKTKARLKIGKLGHLWIIFKGEEVDKIQKVISEFSPERVCMKLSHEQLRHYVAGMLDAYVCKPFYGDKPILRFFSRESSQKRFVQNILILYGYRLVETSCITNHSPKFLESRAIVGKEIPVENPLWDEVLEGLDDKACPPRLFSRIRGNFEIATTPTRIIFREHGFSPIVDGLYTYPQLLPD